MTALGNIPLTDDISAHVSGIPAGLPAGVIFPYAGPSTSIPSGYLLCDGSAVARSSYAALFTAIGTAYGAGNGSTTFNLPNFKGKVPVGVDTAQTEFDALGESGGAKTHTLTTAEMPSHTHTGPSHTHTMAHTHSTPNHTHTVTISDPGHNHVGEAGGSFVTTGNGDVLTNAGTGAANWYVDDRTNLALTNLTASVPSGGGGTTGAASTSTTSADGTGATGSAGSGSAHNNLQPYLTVHFIIKT